MTSFTTFEGLGYAWYHAMHFLIPERGIASFFDGFLYPLLQRTFGKWSNLERERNEQEEVDIKA